jgi:DNA-binding response OmpR family regulator
VRALVRRGPAPRPATLTAGELELDPAAHTVSRNREPVELTAREFALLEYLMRHRGEALSRRQLIDHVWDYTYQGDSNVIDVYIRRLRTKLDGALDLDTVRGVGYRLRDRAPAAHPA